MGKSPVQGAASQDRIAEGHFKSLLMSTPEQYEVVYEINPWMDLRRGIDKALALRQWKELYRTLAEEIGANVQLISPVPALPDLVFTANAGFVVGRTFIASNFRHHQRAKEEPYWETWFKSAGFDVVRLPTGLRFEGEGDLLPAGELLVGGYRFRSDLEAVRQVADLVGGEALPLELADPWFYHLDTCFCPLTKDIIMYYPGAFTASGRNIIMDRFPNAIAVGLEEANRFVCNSITIDRHVVMSCHCPAARRELQVWDFVVHEVNVSEFLKAGGGAKCLVLFLERAKAAKGVDMPHARPSAIKL